jgi:hypothetical protein
MSYGYGLSVEEQVVELIPAWTVRKKSKKEREDWFEKTLEILEKYSQTRIQTHVNNVLWFTGDYDKTSEQTGCTGTGRTRCS